jgi:hypothetical protein
MSKLYLRYFLKGALENRILRLLDKPITLILKRPKVNQLLLLLIIGFSLSMFILAFRQSSSGFWFLLLALVSFLNCLFFNSKNRTIKELVSLSTIVIYLGFSFCLIVAFGFYLLIKTIWF